MIKPVNPKHRMALALAALLLCASLGTLATAKDGRDGGEPSRAEDRADRSDRADRADRQDRADQDARGDIQDRESSDDRDRALRDEQRYQEERAKILEEGKEDPAKAAKELAELEEERQEELQEAQEEALEEAAEAAEELAENGGMTGDSSGMSDVGRGENPDHDSRGYPVRRGEIVALDLSTEGLTRAQGQGYQLIARENLATLGGSVTRLALPARKDPETAIDELTAIEQSATFDYTHYYGLQVTPSGATAATKPAALPNKPGIFTVGMIDTGVARHPALARQQISARDFSRGQTAIPTGHGTAVASILASEGARSLYVANIFRGGTSSPFTSAESIASALEWMAANRVEVVNMSLSGPRNAILDRLIQRTSARGTVIVAAAGNSGPAAPPAYPAALPAVMAVTAVDANHRVYRYANQGPYIDVAARGVNEPAAQSGGGIALFSGTSFAAPHVAAWLATCMTSTSSADCQRRLIAGTRDLGAPGHDSIYGHGLLR